MSLLRVACALHVARAILPAWQQHSQPLKGALVLTDVHAVLTAGGAGILAYATGEAGVLLKLAAPAAGPANATPWVVALDTSFPLYWYGVYTWPEDTNRTLLAGFFDGSGQAYGVIQYTEDGGSTWFNDTILDKSAWGGGPIEFSGAEGLMPSTAGGTAWRTSTGGATAGAWVEVVPDPQNWHSGAFVWDGDGYAAIAGSSFCNSTDFGATWRCGAAEDASGMDGGVACSAPAPGSGACLTGGGEISPAVAGWAHVSRDGGRSWGARSLNAAFPIRTVLAVAPAAGGASGTPPLLIAAGGNYFSGVGGIYASDDLGATWALTLDLGQEVKACRALALPGGAGTRVFCVSAGPEGGSIVSADV